MLREGELAPDFSLKDSNGKEHKLSDYRGKKVVIYFYPKDDTPGCTKEACSFRDANEEIIAKKAVVLGISADTVDSHKKFQDKHSLPFTLLADPERKVIEKFGVSETKSMFGKKFLGTKRTTFVIDEKGRISKIFIKVNVLKHAREVLDYL